MANLWEERAVDCRIPSGGRNLDRLSRRKKFCSQWGIREEVGGRRSQVTGVVARLLSESYCTVRCSAGLRNSTTILVRGQKQSFLWTTIFV